MRKAVMVTPDGLGWFGMAASVFEHDQMITLDGAGVKGFMNVFIILLRVL
jgi:hypothetical protein